MKIQELDYNACYNAYRGISFTPEERAVTEQKSYVKGFENLLAEITKLDPKRKDEIEKDILEFEKKYRKYKMELLATRSGIVSPMITGPANFPVARMRKKTDVMMRKIDKIINFWEKNELRMKKKYKIKEEYTHERMMELIKNKVTKSGMERVVIAAAKQDKVTALKIKEFLEIDEVYKIFTKRHSIRKKVEEIIELYDAKVENIELKNGNLEIDAAANRVRIYFDYKPQLETRTELKKSGFRWSGKKGCWSAYNNSRTIKFAKEILGG